MNKSNSEEIRAIWDEMKELKRMRENPLIDTSNNTIVFDKDLAKLHLKYEEIDTLFGYESTLSKAIIFHLNKQNGTK